MHNEGSSLAGESRGETKLNQNKFPSKPALWGRKPLNQSNLTRQMQAKYLNDTRPLPLPRPITRPILLLVHTLPVAARLRKCSHVVALHLTAKWFEYFISLPTQRCEALRVAGSCWERLWLQPPHLGYWRRVDWRLILVFDTIWIRVNLTKWHIGDERHKAPSITADKPIVHVMKFQMKFQFTTKNARSHNLQRNEAPFNDHMCPSHLHRTANAVISLQFYSTILSYSHSNFALLAHVRSVGCKVAENSPTHLVYVYTYRAMSASVCHFVWHELSVCVALNFLRAKWDDIFIASELCWCGDNFYLRPVVVVGVMFSQ